jgi:AcrR family transcriptional regulator
MGVRERHERDREVVRRAILDAARDLFVAEGYGNVSIRKIAERIEYSPAALYSYFPSKDDIFFALADEGFQLLQATSEADTQPGDATGSALERVRAQVWRLYQFSRQHPQYFALMFVDRSVPRISREYEGFAWVRKAKTQVHADLQECIATGVFPNNVVPSVAFRLLTVGLLGVASMRLSDRLGPGEDADAIAAGMLDTLIAGLRAGAAPSSIVVKECE